MRSTRRLALGASLLASLAIAGTAGGGAIVSAQEDPVFIVGTQGFAEAELMGELYAQALEAGGFSVDRAGLAMGDRPVREAAFDSGQINLMPEYVGFGLEYYTGAPDAAEAIAAIESSGNTETDATSLQQVYDLRGVGATILAPTAGEDTNAAVVRAETADEYDLSAMSDLAAAQQSLRFGLPPDCETNPACRIALEEAYGIAWPPAQLDLIAPCGPVMAGALEGGAVDVAWLCSTQPVIALNGWVVLADDLETQPRGNIVPIVRNDVLELVDGGADAVAAILDPVSEALTTEVLTQLGVRISVDKEDIDVVASEFLASLAE